MTLRDELQAQLHHFDDDAFAALASRGLLRRARKDLEQLTPEVVEADEAVVVRVGQHEVRFDRGGPAAARCSCPASATCQHVLAAAIALQQAPVAATAPALDLPAALMAFTADDFTQHAGKAGHRWAAQFVLDLDLGRDVQIASDANVTITFRHPRLCARFTGGGLGSVVLDASVSKPENYQVAAVLAWQRAHGKAPEVPAPARPAAAAHLDLGRDFTPPSAGVAARDEARRRLRAAYVALACECVELGLSHLSEQVQQRFATLAVWAQGADYPRLARLLRRLADHVELLLDRAGGADEHRLFDELALGHALVAALEAAAAGGREPAALIGSARSRYQEVASLELFGLGAHAFRSASGYAGLTMLFWCAADAAFLACTDARPATLRGFDPIARYRAPGPWSGLGAPQQATGRVVLLTDAQANERGQLSAAERTNAVVRPAEALPAGLPVVSRWRELPTAAPSLLAEAQPLREWSVLRPARFLSPSFDAARQTFAWPLVDDEGVELAAELPWAEVTRHAIERIESLQEDALGPGTLLVARLVRTGGAAAVEPLSLLHPDGADAQLVDALHFDSPPGQGARQRRRGTAAATDEAAAAPDPAPACLGELRDWLRARAERGLAPEVLAGARGELDAMLRRAQAAGCTALPSGSDPALRAGELLLRTDYVCMQYLRLLGRSDDDMG